MLLDLELLCIYYFYYHNHAHDTVYDNYVCACMNVCMYVCMYFPRGSFCMIDVCPSYDTHLYYFSGVQVYIDMKLLTCDIGIQCNIIDVTDKAQLEDAASTCIEPKALTPIQSDVDDAENVTENESADASWYSPTTDDFVT